MTQSPYACMLILTALMTAAATASDTTRIACVGDSITQGNANADWEVNSWPDILQRLLDSTHPGQYEVGNFGRSGATVLRAGSKPYWDEDVFDRAAGFEPDIVFINLGTNDASPYNWVHRESFGRDYRDLVDHFAATAARPRIILSNLTPIFPNLGAFHACLERREEAVFRIMEVALERQLPVVNLYSPLHGRADLFPDGVHPNTAGHEIMAQAVYTHLTGEAAPPDPSLRPRPVAGETHALVTGGVVQRAMTRWVAGDGALRGSPQTGDLDVWGELDGDFHLTARMRFEGVRNHAAAFYLGANEFGLEGARGTLFRNGPDFGFRLLFPSDSVFTHGEWLDFEVIRNGTLLWILVNDRIVDMADLPAEATFDRVGFHPQRATIEVSDLAIVGHLAESSGMPPGYTIPIIDLDGEVERQVIVDREDGQYLGHPTTCLLEDGRTMLCVYPKGHGRGGIVYKRSADGGRTWSERLAVPENWATSREVPTLHRVIDPVTGARRIIMWSGLYPARLAVTEDDGATWSPLAPVGEWGGIVVMGAVERRTNGDYLAWFHDDGRFFTADGTTANPVVFTLYQTESMDGGLTWSPPHAIWSGDDVHLCEPGVVRSPDGATLALLLRENSRRRNSHVVFSTDEGRTWSEPRELPGALTGDRHTACYTPDGRLFISFRDTTRSSATHGDWVGWVGTWDDIVKGREGQYRVRLKDNHVRADCAYPGVAILPGGTIVTTTYGHWEPNAQPYILSVRFTLDELDARLSDAAP